MCVGGVQWGLGELPKDQLMMLGGLGGMFRTAVGSAPSWCGLHTPQLHLLQEGVHLSMCMAGLPLPCVGWGQGCTGLELVSSPMPGSGGGACITPISVSIVMGPLPVCLSPP